MAPTTFLRAASGAEHGLFAGTDNPLLRKTPRMPRPCPWSRPEPRRPQSPVDTLTHGTYVPCAMLVTESYLSAGAPLCLI